MPDYLGEERTIADLEALVAAYAGPPRRPVSRKAKALVLRYLLLRTVRTPADARALALEDEKENRVDLITFAVTVALIGFIVWLLVTYVPMPAPIRTALVVIVVLVLVLWAVRAFIGPIPSVR